MDANWLHIYMWFGHGNAGQFVLCIKENKELACYCHKERSYVSYYQTKEIIIKPDEIMSQRKVVHMFSHAIHASRTYHKY